MVPGPGEAKTPAVAATATSTITSETGWRTSNAIDTTIGGARPRVAITRSRDGYEAGPAQAYATATNRECSSANGSPSPPYASTRKKPAASNQSRSSGNVGFRMKTS